MRYNKSQDPTSKKLSDYLAIIAYINSVYDTATEETHAMEVKECCTMVDNFWKNHCERRKELLFGLITYTVHDHAAKGLWRGLNHCVRQLGEESKKL